MNNSTDSNSKMIIRYILPKFFLFYLGINILDYNNQFKLSMLQHATYNQEIKLLSYIIPLAVITIFAFYRFGLRNYFVGSLILVGLISIFITLKPQEDEFRMFMVSNTNYVIWSFIGGLLVTEAFIDPDAAKAKIIKFAKEQTSTMIVLKIKSNFLRYKANLEQYMQKKSQQ